MICVQRSCEPLADARVAASADVMLQFSLTGRVHSLVYAWLDPRRAARNADWSCADLQVLPRAMSDPILNVVASGFVNFQATQGTAFFPDANLGQVPVGNRILIAEGREQARGEGAVVAWTCQEGVEASVGQDLSLSLRLDPSS